MGPDIIDFSELQANNKGPANSYRDPSAYLAPWVEVSIHIAYSDNSRIPRTKLSFQDMERKNLYTRTFEWTCELWDNWGLILKDSNWKFISFKEVFPGISSWILWESPVNSVSTQVSAQVHQLTPLNLAQIA